MKRQAFLFLLLLFVLSPVFHGNFAEETHSRSPSAEYRPWVYWFWNNGNITQEGIDADLEAMHRVSIGSVLLMEVDCGAPLGAVPHMGDEWRELFKHMISKAASLGIKVVVNDGPGGNGCSGPWAKPENATKILTARIAEISADNRPGKIVLPQGDNMFDYQ